MHMRQNYPKTMTFLLFRYLPELTGPKLSFTRSRRRDKPGEPIKSAHTFEIVLQISPQSLKKNDNSKAKKSTLIKSHYILPKLFAAYIQHKRIFWNIYIPQPCTRLTFIPRTVGMIYPIPTYILNWHIFPKLLAAYIQYKYIFQQIYIPQHCAQRAHRNSNNTCSPQVSAWYIQYPRIYSTDIYSPNCWLHLSNNKFNFFKCERHTRRSCVVKEQSRPIYMCIHAFSEFPPFWTVLCCKHNTFTFSMFDHGLNGHPNKIPTHISLKWSYICFWYWKWMEAKQLRGVVGRGLGRQLLGSIPTHLRSWMVIPTKSQQIKYWEV